MQIDENFSHWLGLVQADGFVSKYSLKNGEQRCEFGFENTSENLTKEFSDGLKILGRRAVVIRTGRGTYKCKISAISIENVLKSMNIKLREKEYSPLEEMSFQDKLFGAYLAGVIDGDGDVRIKRKSTYPQCAIRISSGSVQPVLLKLIKQRMKCAVSERFRSVSREGKIMKWFELEFLVSSKNSVFIKSFVLPYIKLGYKKEKVQAFIEKRW